MALAKVSFGRTALLLAAAAWWLVAVTSLSACGTPVVVAPAAAPVPAPLTVPAELPAVPEPVPEPQAVMPVLPATPAAQKQAQQAAFAAAEMLEAGNEEAAQREIKRALGLDAQNALAASLARQINADPATAYGRESFAYTVKAGETLSLIAERFLKDKFLFYLLARYNDIKVPRQVSSGQVIRVPGKAASEARASSPDPRFPPSDARTRPLPASTVLPPVAKTPVPASALPAMTAASGAAVPPTPPSIGEQALRKAAAAEKGGSLTLARIEYLIASSHGQPGAAVKAEQMRKLLVTQHSTQARMALSRQNLDGSLAHWQKVLELDPGNTTAQREIDHVLHLKEKLINLK